MNIKLLLKALRSGYHGATDVADEAFLRPIRTGIAKNNGPKQIIGDLLDSATIGRMEDLDKGLFMDKANPLFKSLAYNRGRNIANTSILGAELGGIYAGTSGILNALKPEKTAPVFHSDVKVQPTPLAPVAVEPAKVEEVAQPIVAPVVTNEIAPTEEKIKSFLQTPEGKKTLMALGITAGTVGGLGAGAMAINSFSKKKKKHKGIEKQAFSAQDLKTLLLSLFSKAKTHTSNFIQSADNGIGNGLNNMMTKKDELKAFIDSRMKATSSQTGTYTNNSIFDQEKKAGLQEASDAVKAKMLEVKNQVAKEINARSNSNINTGAMVGASMGLGGALLSPYEYDMQTGKKKSKIKQAILNSIVGGAIGAGSVAMYPQAEAYVKDLYNKNLA